jgi:predicted aldo/keto reductase-like oxidoreductase
MRNLGDTDIKIKRIGFGGLPIQRINQEETNDVINEIEKYGINFIDSARGYTISEEAIGNAIEGRRDKFFIATKSMARDYEGMKKDIEISLKNFKTDFIDLYQLHNVKAEEYDKVFEENMAYKALLEAKEEGKIRYIGITSHSLETIGKAIDTNYFATVQFPYNMVEIQADEVLKKAHEKGIGTIVMKPLAGGNLDDAELALKYIMSRDHIDVAIPGMDKVEQVGKNIKVADNHKLTDEDINNIEEIRTTLGNKFCRRCEYCMPCTVGINIPTNFLFEGYFTRYNLKDWATDRYESQEVKPSACIECGVCQSRCPYDLPIIDMLKNVVEKLKK